MFFRRELDSLAADHSPFSLTVVYTRAAPEGHPVGRLDAPTLAEHVLGNGSDPLVYICGATAFVEKSLPLVELPPAAAIGRFHEKPVGPHPHWSFQMAFGADSFERVIAWLESKRGGLDVLVHGETGDDYADHTAHAMWLGIDAPLDLSAFTRKNA